VAYTPFNTNLGKSTQPGRPAWVNNLVVMRQPDNASGFEFSRSEQSPGALAAAQERYISKHEMPAALRPKMVSMPEPLNQRRRRAISAGWRNPRGAA
jgi:hypothetical protein